MRRKTLGVLGALVLAVWVCTGPFCYEFVITPLLPPEFLYEDYRDRLVPVGSVQFLIVTTQLIVGLGLYAGTCWAFMSSSGDR